MKAHGKKSGGRWLVLSDLDGTLLDERLSWEAARGAREALRRVEVPLGLASSKTWAELEGWVEALQAEGPLVAENGGVVQWGERGRRRIGVDREDLVAFLQAERTAGRVAYQSFADWGVAELMRRTELSREGAEAALRREATEPLLWEGSDAQWEGLCREVEARGWRLVRGGRFWHLQGDFDKGQAVEGLRKEGWRVLALGNAPNDLGMLRAADRGVWIPEGEGRDAPEAGLELAGAPGPCGWTEAVERWLLAGL